LTLSGAIKENLNRDLVSGQRFVSTKFTQGKFCVADFGCCLGEVLPAHLLGEFKSLQPPCDYFLAHAAAD